MATFYMRTTRPSNSNKFYHDYAYNPFATASLCMPNCTCYAYGRFSEIMGSRCKLPTGNAGTWYGQATMYKRGQTPQVGAVMCWANGRAGHVAIVEKVNVDSRGRLKSVLCSQSSYGSNHNGTYFCTYTLTPSGYTDWMGSGATFQGFIYNPAVANGTCKKLADGGNDGTSKITQVTTNTGGTTGNKQTLGAGEAFVQIAKSWAGKNPEAHKWVQSQTTIGNGPWCAAFVCACAKNSNILGKVIGNSYGCNQMVRITTKDLGGTYVKGPAAGNTSFIPCKGDLVFFVWDRRYRDGDYDHVGIVVGYSTNPLKLITVEGNMGAGCVENSYTMGGGDWHDLKQVAAYIRPAWSKVGGVTVDLDMSGWTDENGVPMLDDYGFGIRMFDRVNTREDAILREVGYVNTKNEPSINTSKVQLSVINYTPLYTGIVMAMMENNPGLLTDIKSAINTDNSYSSAYDSSKLSAMPKRMYDYLITKGLNPAVCCGIIANAYHESGYRTDCVGDNGTSFGLFQWHTYGKEMIQKVPDWRNNMSGQLDFLMYQLTAVGEFKYIYNKLQAVPVTASGAQQAAEIFVRDYERPADISGAVVRRRATALELWNQLTPVARSTS